MASINKERFYKRDMMLATAMIAAGAIIAGLSLVEIRSGHAHQQIAQATQPLQSTPGADTKPSAPLEPTTTGVRPAETSPQPARPDADAQKAGAAPALPPAPAEKTAAPIKEK